MTARRIYLDNAATTFPKPPEVHGAMARFASDLGASPGRGAYRESIEGGRLIDQCRRRLARVFAAPSHDHVVFTLNCSDALNLAIKGVVRSERSRRLRSGDDRAVHVVTTAMDHNSVLRPLNALASEPSRPAVEWTCVDADPQSGRVDAASLRSAIRPSTVLVVAGHASNVSGTIQPIADFAAVCKDAGVLFLVDAAQTAGRLPLGLDGVDLLAAPGHKHLLGPLGTGLLVVRPGVEDRLEPLREGGTGSLSELDTQPLTMPDRFEPGSHNTIGLAGLSAGVAWVLDRGVESLWAHERRLIERACHALADTGRFSGLRLLGPVTDEGRVGVFCLTHEAMPPADLASVLESEFGVLSRAGLHCAPRAHAVFGTLGSGGATRLSIGPFTSDEELDAALGALAEICANAAATP